MVNVLDDLFGQLPLISKATHMWHDALLFELSLKEGQHKHSPIDITVVALGDLLITTG